MTDELRILNENRTVAVVGASRDPRKAAHAVPAFLQAIGFRVIPVNPHADELLGERCHPTLEAIEEPVDVVDVFRPAEEAPELARLAAKIGARALWLQLGLRSAEAKRIASESGMDYVEDRCMAKVAGAHGVRKSPATA